jgi:hypothetical protein
MDLQTCLGEEPLTEKDWDFLESLKYQNALTKEASEYLIECLKNGSGMTKARYGNNKFSRTCGHHLHGVSVLRARIVNTGIKIRQNNGWIYIFRKREEKQFGH